MATDVSSMPVNGNYAPHQGYGSIEQQQNSYAYGANAGAPSQVAPAQPPPSSSTPASSAVNQQSDIPKDEVGWYFVEQYYTTLSRSPEKLYLFYNKRSQFVSGQETDKVAVCVGQRAINDRIKELDFQDCKVRVTNVDSQASDANIVIQVIGEISNKSQPHKKFTQTFVLATQTNGYFVLNDIFRYLQDEEDEPEPEATPAQEDIQQAPAAESGYQEPVPPATEVEPKTLTSSMDPAAVEHDAKQVDKELEQKVLKDEPSRQEASEPTVNGVPETEPEVKQVDDVPAIAVAEPDEPAVEESTQPLPEVDQVQAEKPLAPEPTPAASPPKQATPQPAPPPKPAAPKTWASLAASANRVATPATPSTASSTSSQTKPPPSTGKSAIAAASTSATTPSTTAPPSAPTAPAAAQQSEDSPAPGSQGDEWTAVGSSHTRQQSRQTNQQQEGPPNRGYIKNVYESIDSNELKTKLEEFGELTYFDISRQKVCH